MLKYVWCAWYVRWPSIPPWEIWYLPFEYPDLIIDMNSAGYQRLEYKNLKSRENGWIRNDQFNNYFGKKLPPGLEPETWGTAVISHNHYTTKDLLKLKFGSGYSSAKNCCFIADFCWFRTEFAIFISKICFHAEFISSIKNEKSEISDQAISPEFRPGNSDFSWGSPYG